MKYVDVSGSVHIVVGIIGLLWLLCSIYNVVSCIVSRMEKQFVIPSVLLTITACVFNHGLAEAENEPSKMVEIGKMTGSIPVCFIVGMLFLFLGLQLVWDGYIRQKKRKIIMPQTVKHNAPQLVFLNERRQHTVDLPRLIRAAARLRKD